MADTGRATTAPDHEVLIVGAGFSGIGTAIRLDKAGIHDFRIIEGGDGVGGTWYWNTYPGVAVDIPSFSYQFSFEKRPTWSRVYAPGTELQNYAEHCVDKYGLRSRIRFNTRIESAAFDEGLSLWRLTTGDGEELTTRFLVNASGILTEPKRPDIDGVDDFAGITLHTARWDHSVDLRGTRVAVIGTGASAVQLIPEIAPQVEHLTVFQRTPVWCIPKLDKPLSPRAQTVLAKVPGAMRATRLLSQTLVEIGFPLAAHYHGKVPIAHNVENMARRYLEEQVHDPALRDKLTPRYAFGCKRPTFHNTYLATFNRENVHLETTPITSIGEHAVHTEDGVAHEVDVLVLATGFKVFDPGNMPTFDVHGVDGVGLYDWWDENRFQAYEGVSIPGFPNLFLTFGPYGYNGSSYFNLVETQSRHILRCLQRARTEGATRVEVRREANDRYFQEMLAKRGDQIFWQDSCSLANSYYFNKHGDVPLRPAPTLETAWRAQRFDLDDYRFERAPVREPLAGRESVST